jgi:hypothetical protein
MFGGRRETILVSLTFISVTSGGGWGSLISTFGAAKQSECRLHQAARQ